MKKFWVEFKAFISRGNIVDMAIGIIIGGAFGKIVTSLVNDLIMPLITWALGASSLADLSIVLRKATDTSPALTWNYGNFIQTIIDFLIIAFCIFTVLKLMVKSQEAFKLLSEEVTKGKPTKKQKAELKKRGVNLKDKEAVKLELSKIICEENAVKAAKTPEVKPETEQEILSEIRDLLKQNATNNITSKEQESVSEQALSKKHKRIN